MVLADLIKDTIVVIFFKYNSLTCRNRPLWNEKGTDNDAWYYAHKSRLIRTNQRATCTSLNLRRSSSASSFADRKVQFYLDANCMHWFGEWRKYRCFSFRTQKGKIAQLSLGELKKGVCYFGLQHMVKCLVGHNQSKEMRKDWH